MFKCNCVNVEPGSYANQIFVHAPAHMPKDNGYCLDACIAEEVMILWQLGIVTTGCCCGHHKAPPFIGVSDEFILTMKIIGYDVQPNPLRPGAQDSFKPKGTVPALNLLKHIIEI